VEPISHFFYSDRLKLQFWDYGQDGKPSLVLVHGALDHARNWDWVAQELCRDYHVFALDLRGHGNSAWAPGAAYTVAEHVLDLSALLDVINDFPIRLIGHSLGGGRLSATCAEAGFDRGNGISARASDAWAGFGARTAMDRKYSRHGEAPSEVLPEFGRGDDAHAGSQSAAERRRGAALDAARDELGVGRIAAMEVRQFCARVCAVWSQHRGFGRDIGTDFVSHAIFLGAGELFAGA
jgi:pimeloyl-ACP methyl ester carboxylesterase